MNDAWSGFYARQYRHLLAYVRGETSIDFDLLLSLTKENPKTEYHAEFVAVAIAALIRRGILEKSAISSSFVCELLALFQPNHATSNWRLMACIGGSVLGKRDWPQWDALKKVLIQGDDGVLFDEPGQVSSQYHSYLLLLTILFFHGEERDLLAAKAFTWLNRHYDATGNASGCGRGKFQKFGYAALLAANGIWEGEGRTGLHPQCQSSATAALFSSALAPSALIGGFQCPDPDFLLHGYNSADDYNAFTDFWSALLFPAVPFIPEANGLTAGHKAVARAIVEDGYFYAFAGNKLLWVLRCLDGRQQANLGIKEMAQKLIRLCYERLPGHHRQDGPILDERLDAVRAIPWGDECRLLYDPALGMKFTLTTASHASYELSINEACGRVAHMSFSGSTQLVELTEPCGSWRVYRVRLIRSAKAEFTFEVI